MVLYNIDDCEYCQSNPTKNYPSTVRVPKKFKKLSKKVAYKPYILDDTDDTDDDVIIHNIDWITFMDYDDIWLYDYY